MNPQVLQLLAGLAGRQGIGPQHGGGLGDGVPAAFSALGQSPGIAQGMGAFGQIMGSMPGVGAQIAGGQPPPIPGAVRSIGPVAGGSAAQDQPPSASSLFNGAYNGLGGVLGPSSNMGGGMLGQGGGITAANDPHKAERDAAWAAYHKAHPDAIQSASFGGEYPTNGGPQWPPGYTPQGGGLPQQGGNMDGTGQGVLPAPFPGGGAQGNPAMGGIMQLLGSLFGQGGQGGQGGLSGLLGGLLGGMGGGQRGTGNQQGGFGGGGGSNGSVFNPFQQQPFNPQQAAQGMAPRAASIFNNMGSNQQFYAPHNNVPQMNPLIRMIMAMHAMGGGQPHQPAPAAQAPPAAQQPGASPVSQQGPGLGSAGQPVGGGGRNLGKPWMRQGGEEL